ncbi:MAG: Ig-like domain-containing protein, partial [Nanoarchaeota archaeon]
MENKEGKLELKSILLVSVVLFASFAILVFSSDGIDATFPENATNASAYFGYSPSANNASFNGTNASFHCTVMANGTVANNITNVSLFISTNQTSTDSALKNQTLNTTTIGVNPEVIIFNITTAFDEGTYWWFCEAENNVSDNINYNTTTNRTFIIDYSGPGYTNLTNTTNTDVSTGDVIYISANFTDTYTTIHTVRLFVNITGSADTEVATAEGANSTISNLSYTIPGHLLDDVLNFTLWANDSVNNWNISSPIIFEVTKDGTPPGITLNKPISLFNQTSTSIEFNFTAYDNNNSELYNFTCGINTSLGGSVFVVNISNIDVTNGTAQLNSTTNISTTLSNGTYTWNVSCTDKAGNLNTSLSQTFTIDQIAPVFDQYNFTHNATSDFTDPVGFGLNTSDFASSAQGRTIYARANWTDNLTQPYIGVLQFYNVSKAAGSRWQTLNTSYSNISLYEYWTNFSYPIPKAHDVFEGQNVSFRIVANDTLGNINDSMSVKNFTIQINDTTAPTITITLPAANNSNQSSDTLTVNWTIDENNPLTEINISVDGVGLGTQIESPECNKWTRHTTDTADFRNGTLTTTNTPTGCGLGNGTHYVVVQSTDSWGNSFLENRTFNVESASIPSINLTSLSNGSIGITDSFNGSSVTPYTGLNFTALDGATSTIKNLTFTSSCNSTEQEFAVGQTPTLQNGSFIWPFNYTSCKGTEANRTVSITVYDFAGNSLTKLYQFQVDDIVTAVPVIHYPADGFSTYGSFNLSASAFDSMSQIDSIGYYLDGGEGWTLLLNHTIENGRNLTIAQGLNTSILNSTINYTGTHTLKVRVNDTMGNERNSSVITFTQNGPINMLWANQTIADNNAGNVSNVSFFYASGALIEGSADTNQTLQLYMELNNTPNEIRVNVTINFNGSAANWNLTSEIYVWLNDSAAAGHIINNHTVDVADMVYVNRSFARFLSNNNSYFAMIRMSQNGSLLGGSGYELWYFEDETDVSSRTNIT